MEYIVLNGDSLWKIALTLLGNGNLYKNILKDNNLTSEVILPGLKLKINVQSPSTSEYTVKSGDNLSTIAVNNGITLSELIRLNSLTNPNNILIGLKLQIPLQLTYTAKLRSTSEIHDIELKLNQKSDLDIINIYHKQKKTGEFYLVDDKKNNKLHVYKDGNLVKSYKAIHGKNSNLDEMTITSTDAKGHIINLAGNLSTPAGLYFSNRTNNYKGYPAFVRSRKDGTEIPSSIHVRTITENANTNRCTGISDKDMLDLTKYIGRNTRTYILPVDSRNRFYIRNGELLFKAGLPITRPNGTDRIVNGKKKHSLWDLGLITNYNTQVTTPISLIRFNTKGLSDHNREIINNFSKSLISNKKSLLVDLGINNDSYNLLARYALGILGVESSYGNENSGIGNFVRAARKAIFKNNSSPDYKSKYHTYGINGDNNSVGLTLIRFSFLSPEEKKLFAKYGITKDEVVNNPGKAAIATMIKLATEFKNSGNNADVAVRRWNNKPSYLSQVQSHANRFNIYLKYLKGGLLTQNDRDFLWDLHEDFGADKSKPSYFLTWNFLRALNDANNYFNSYLQSQGLQRILNNLKRWWESRHPYRKWYSNFDKGTSNYLLSGLLRNPVTYTADLYPELSATYRVPKYGASRIIVGNEPYASLDSQESWSFEQALGHETTHAKWPLEFVKSSALSEAIDLNKNTEKNHHDEYLSEKYADVLALKYMFYKSGIYDVRDNKDITIQQVQLLRKKYPKFRAFQQMSDEQIQFMINTVADNGNKSLDPNYLT